jgi:CMP-N,N'-diacetyllegionaminic acid synthase
MINRQSVIAIIPARGGSKGLPGKNIRELCGKPLIAWSIEAGLHSQYIDEVMVSTDNETIAAIGKQYGASVPFLRPAELASDTATSYSAVEHALDFYATNQRRNFDYVVLLEPTSPLRAKSDIDEMLEKLTSLSERYDAIVSLGQVHEHPAIMKKLSGNEIKPYCHELEQKTRRQDQEAAYFPYGVAYIIKTAALFEEKTFYPCRTTYKIIQRYQCYEIDDLYDFLTVESVMKHELVSK